MFVYSKKEIHEQLVSNGVIDLMTQILPENGEIFQRNQLKFLSGDIQCCFLLVCFVLPLNYTLPKLSLKCLLPPACPI